MSILSASPTPLWNMFDTVSSTALRWSPKNFKFVVGETPLSTFSSVAAAIAVYYVVIFGGREIMRPHKAFTLATVNKVHNLMLTIVSGTLLALTAEQLVPALLGKGLSYNMCGNGGFTSSLTTLYYLNYLTKYLEFLDTVLLVLRKKPLSFLHTYHHGATAFLCYTQLIGHTPVAWVPIVLNLSVHVLMYWYYFRACCGIKSWYKEYITIMQIAQFVVDLGAIYYVSYNLFANAYLTPLANSCAANLRQWTADLAPAEVPKSEVAALVGMLCLTSYLFLFIGFYFATYKSGAKKGVAVAGKKAVPRGTVESDLREKSKAIMEAMPVAAKHVRLV